MRVCHQALLPFVYADILFFPGVYGGWSLRPLCKRCSTLDAWALPVWGLAPDGELLKLRTVSCGVPGVLSSMQSSSMWGLAVVLDILTIIRC